MINQSVVTAREKESQRNVNVLAATLVALGIGEELWQPFLPAYVVALGGSAMVVGAFGSCRDLLDGLYQLPGGWVSEKLGARAAITWFTATAAVGYVAYAVAGSWPIAFIGLAGAMAWKAGAFPATFALIAESLAPGRRVGGFTLQSIAVRVPRVVAAPAGGLLVGWLGLTHGVRAGLVVAVVLALCAVVLQRRLFERRAAAAVSTAPLRVAPLTQPLRRLLVAECLVRIGEAIAATFVVLYVTGVHRMPLAVFGGLYAVQHAIALASYLPATRLVAAIGSRALVAATFTFFALFPLALVWASGFWSLLLAFVVAGLKEVGEPARKALIVDLCDPSSCARQVGAYYTVRNLLVVPGGMVGGLLWQHSPALVLQVAGMVCTAGLLIFVSQEASAWAGRPRDAGECERPSGRRPGSC